MVAGGGRRWKFDDEEAAVGATLVERMAPEDGARWADEGLGKEEARDATEGAWIVLLGGPRWANEGEAILEDCMTLGDGSRRDNDVEARGGSLGHGPFWNVGKREGVPDADLDKYLAEDFDGWRGVDMGPAAVLGGGLHEPYTQGPIGP